MRAQSEEEALAIVVQALTAELEHRITLTDGDAWPEGKALPLVYLPAGDFPSGHWLATLEADPPRVGASVVFVVRKADGRLVFQGRVGE